jgi:hypothetical protein
MLRRAAPVAVVLVLVAVVLVLAACEGAPPAPPSPTSIPTATETVTPSPTPDPSPSTEPSPTSEPDPGEMPTSIAADLSPADLVPEDLVPAGADVTGEWFAFTDRGEMVVIAWVEPGSDYSRLPRGFAVWRRFSSPPHWRTDLVERHDPGDEIQEIQITTADLTGDSSDDALVVRGIGGSGACGRWSVIDLARGEEIYRRELCDARIEPGPPGAPGLILTESVFRPGDAHCCPSAIRTTTLAWTGARWRVSDRTSVET